MTDWTKTSAVPRGGLEVWLQYEPGVSAHNFIKDYSGKGRDVACGAGNAPVLTPNILNGQPAWYFNGTRDPLTYSGTYSVNYVFAIGSFVNATFSEYQGFYTGLTVGDLLVSNNSSDLMFYNGLSAWDYRKNDVLYADNARKAPVSNSHSFMEMIIPTITTPNGISLGQDRTFTARKLNGWFVELLAYSTLPTQLMRLKLQLYAAMRYRIWPRIVNDQPVFPFPSDKSYSRDHGRETYLSEPYEGDSKALVRGEFVSHYDLLFNLRRQEEFEAARSFYEQQHPLGEFTFRDYRYYPPIDKNVRFASDLRERGSDVTNRFNYGFTVREMT